MSTASTLEKPKTAAMVPFAIEADPPGISDLLIQSIPGCRLRGAISTYKPNRKTPFSQDQLARLSAFPPIPGMQLFVNPKSCTYTIHDPLEKNKSLCEEIHNGLMASDNPWNPKKVKGCPDEEGKLDKHRMKTLVREMISIVDSGHGKMVTGPKPSMKEIEALPGHFLLNPGADSECVSTQPRFEKDWDNWFERLVMSGG